MELAPNFLHFFINSLANGSLNDGDFQVSTLNAICKLLSIMKKPMRIQKNISNLVTPNYAFLGFRRSDKISHEKIVEKFSELRIPFEHVNLKDAHHFEVWKHFLDKGNYPYRDMSDDINNRNLDQNYFCEISSE